MRRELDKYGIQMPAFSKIGGMLANEVCSIDLRSLSLCLLAHSPSLYVTVFVCLLCCVVVVVQRFDDCVCCWTADTLLAG